MTGAVYLVGAGPGAVDLLTLRAARLLAEADIVLHDALVSADVLALAPQAKLLNVGKRANRPSVDQRLICRLLVRLAQRYETIVRLKGGDPSLFGRAGEELAACRAAGVPVTIVPGVTAAVAGAAALGVSLTLRGISRSVAFVTPSRARNGADNQHWAKAAVAAETAVIYMGATQADLVRASLLKRGAPASRPIALVESATSGAERILRGRLEDLPVLASRLGEGPALIIVGEVVAEADVGRLAAANVA
ncbi:MAG: uroporphyrinogen-III C-methyltransferase [Caulobacteraceae bacterium]